MNPFALKNKAVSVTPIPLVLVIPAMLLQFFPESQSHLQFDREIGFGFWRWVTCHWTHWSWDHFIWDAVVVVVVGTICERVSGRRSLASLMLSILVIPLVVQSCLPEIQTYRGLSGLGSALFGLLVGLGLREAFGGSRMSNPAWWALLGAGFVAKLGYEVITGTTLFVDSVGASFVPVPLVHLAGLAIGLLCGCVSAHGANRHPSASSGREFRAVQHDECKRCARKEVR